MLKQIAIIGLLCALILSGCSYDDDKVAKILLGKDLYKVAEIDMVEYLPSGDEYFTFMEFSLPIVARTNWLKENFAENDCETFETLNKKEYVSEKWLERSKTGTCYINISVVENKLAPYNEISLLLYENDILLYAAGTENDE